VYVDIGTFYGDGGLIIEPTGHYAGVEFSHTADGGFYSYNGGTNGNSHAWLYASVNGASSGDPFVGFDINGVTAWAIGADNSDSDSFKISKTNLGVGLDFVIITTSGNVGINSTGPDRRLDVLDASNPQLRLTYTDGSVYTDFQTDSGGRLLIAPSAGGRVVQTANNSIGLLSLETSGGTSHLQLYSQSSTETRLFSIQSGVDLVFGTNNTGRLKIESGGTVCFGTHSAIGTETVTGYITMKDAGGTTRKLAVVS
jgi:hypothetical protein